jgi:hypothetical protein
LNLTTRARISVNLINIGTVKSTDWLRSRPKIAFHVIGVYLDSQDRIKFPCRLQEFPDLNGRQSDLGWGAQRLEDRLTKNRSEIAQEILQWSMGFHH